METDLRCSLSSSDSSFLGPFLRECQPGCAITDLEYMVAVPMAKLAATSLLPGASSCPHLCRKKKSRVWAQHFVPCIISQLFSATLNEGVLKIRNADISQVIFVGIIRHAEKAPTKIIYKTDDVTAAAMDVCQWVDTEDASGENTVVTPETYLNVTQRHTWTWLATSGLFITKRGW